MISLSNYSPEQLSEVLDKLTPAELVEAQRLIEQIETCEYSEDFSKFLTAAWPVLEPGTVFKSNWHIDCVCEYLQAVTLGQIRRLIINIPPRHGKSLMCSVHWPCWSWTRRPELRFMFASYSGSLSIKHSVDRRSLLLSPWYRKRWQHLFDLAEDQNEKTKYANTQRGHMIATSVGGSATGLGGNVLVVDDPVNPEEAYSDAERKTANRQFDQTLTTRLDQPAEDAIVIIMQRLHEEDTTGHVLAKRSINESIYVKPWVHLKLPTECEKAGEKIIFPLSGRVHERKEGELLNPARYPREVVEQAKVDLGPVGFAGQHQQSPTALEGNIIKRQWIRYWTPQGMIIPGCKELPVEFDREALSLDCTFKDTDGSDFVALHCWAQRLADYFLIDRDTERRDFPSTQQVVLAMAAKHPKAHAKFVEDKANGPAVIASLRTLITGLIPVEPRGSKSARLYSVSPEFASGNVYLPHPSICPWVVAFVDQICGVPNVVNDDDADATSQAIDQLRKMNSSLMKWLAAEEIKKQEKLKALADGVTTGYVPPTKPAPPLVGGLGNFLQQTGGRR